MKSHRYLTSFDVAMRGKEVTKMPTEMSEILMKTFKPK